MLLVKGRWSGGNNALALLYGLIALAFVSGNAVAEQTQPKVIEKRKRAETRFHTPPPNSIKIGPIQVALIAGGRTVAGKIQFSVVAADEAARTKLQAGQDAIYGIVYPLAIKLYASGRPDKKDIRSFKSNAKAQLNSRFGDAVKVVLLKMLY